MSGFILLHRKMQNWEWYDNSEMVHLFLHLLLSANHKAGKWRGIEVERGQLITSIDKISIATKISIQTVRTCLKRMESTEEISRKSTNKNTIITICKYDDYNRKDDEANKQLTNNQQSTNKQLTTNNNINNDNNDNKKEGVPKKAPTPPADLLKIRQKAFAEKLVYYTKTKDNPEGKYKPEMIRKFYDYWREPNSSETKMRFELEKTWRLNLRLAKWANSEFVNKKNDSTTNEELVYTPLPKAIDHGHL